MKLIEEQLRRHIERLEKYIEKLEDNMSLKWHKQFPTAADHGKWFFVKLELEDHCKIDLMEVRLGQDGKLYLGQPCNEGMQAQSYGTLLSLYADANKQYNHTSFAGPIELPEGFDECRKQFYASTTHKIRMAMVR